MQTSFLFFFSGASSHRLVSTLLMPRFVLHNSGDLQSSRSVTAIYWAKIMAQEEPSQISVCVSSPPYNSHLVTLVFFLLLISSLGLCLVYLFLFSTTHWHKLTHTQRDRTPVIIVLFNFFQLIFTQVIPKIDQNSLLVVEIKDLNGK